MKTTYTSTEERGILTSAYKREIRANASKVKRESLSNFKSYVTYESAIESQTATVLRISLFVVTLLMISL